MSPVASTRVSDFSINFFLVGILVRKLGRGLVYGANWGFELENCCPLKV
jgi:hypothetical protein